MQSKAQLQVEQITRGAVPNGPIPLKSRKEESVVRATEDEMISLLKEIRDNRHTGASVKTTITTIIGIVGLILIIAAYIANLAADKRALEININAVTQRNGELWQMIQGQQLMIEDINKRDAVRKALEDEAKRRR